MKLKARLTALFLLLALIPMTISSYLGYTSGRQQIKQLTLARLNSINSLKGEELNRWVEENERFLQELAQRPLVRVYAETLTTEADTAVLNATYDALLRNHLTPFLTQAGGFVELFLLGPEDGRILISTYANDQGKFREHEPFFIWGKRQTVVQNVYYDLDREAPMMTIATPVYEDDGRLLAVLAGHLDLDEVSNIMLQCCEENETLETYLINRFNFFVSDARSVQDGALKETAYSSAITACLSPAAEPPFHQYNDYRGIPVFGVYAWLDKQELCILTEIDQSEAFAPIQALRNRLLTIGLLTAVLTMVIVFPFAHTLTHPIYQLVVGAKALGKGDLSYRIPDLGNAELGELAHAFNEMAVKRQQAEEALRDHQIHLEQVVDARTKSLSESERRYRTLAEAAPDFVFVINADFSIQYVNSHAAQRFNQSPSDLRRRDWLALFPPDDVTLQRDSLQTVFETGRPLSLEEKLTFSGELTWMSMKLTPIARKDGQVTAVMGVARDVTEQRAAEQALRDSEERLSLVIEASNTGIWDWKIQEDIIFFSTRWKSMLGYDDQEIENRFQEWEDRLHPDDKARMLTAVFDFLENPIGSFNHEFRMQHKDGSYRWILNRSAAVVNVHGKPIRMLGSHLDITELKRVQVELAEKVEALARSNEELQQFAYIASHDLQEPLRMVTSYLQLLKRRYAGRLDADADEFIEFAVNGSVRMKSLIQDLLAYSRVGTRGQALRSISSQEVFDSTLRMMKVSVDENDAVITADPLPQVMADPGQLGQLFQNLLGNGMKFRREAPPRIHVCAQQDGKMWQFSVCDNGIGIEDDYHERIFVIFQRLHTSSEYNGTGIGLAVCKKIVERHGGRIWFESTPGSGSTFYFTLPRVLQDELIHKPQGNGRTHPL